MDQLVSRIRIDPRAAVRVTFDPYSVCSHWPARGSGTGSAARHALDVVLAQAHPRGRAEDGCLVFPDPEGTELDASGRTVVLAPVLSRLDVSISNLDRKDLVWPAYPVAPTAVRDDPTGLAALLTPCAPACCEGSTASGR